MTLSQIALRTRMSAATVRRSLITLEYLGYVRRQGRNFLLAPKVLTLGASYFEAMNLKEVAQPFLAALTERFHDASSLTVLEGFEVLHIAHVASDQRVTRSRNVGTRLPAHATSTGLVLLSHTSARHQQRLMSLELTAYTSRTPVQPTALKALLAGARRNDDVVARDILEFGSIALAVPVRTGHGKVVAAVNCSARTEAISEAAPIRTRPPALRDASARIGEMIDHYPQLARSLTSH